MSKKSIIDAGELASYVVCPESWRLKLEKEKETFAPRNQNSKAAAKSRNDWIQTHSNIAQIKLYAKVAYVLLVMLVIVVFLMELSSNRI